MSKNEKVESNNLTKTDEHFLSGDLIEKNGNADEDDEDLVDAEELTNKKKLRENNSKQDRPISPISQTLAASLSQESFNPEENSIHLSGNSNRKNLSSSGNISLKTAKNNDNIIDPQERNEKQKSPDDDNYIHDQFTKIKSIKMNNKLFYPISTEQYSQFESLLFDLMGFKNESFKLDESQIGSNIKSAPNFDLIDEKDLILINDMELLNNRLEINQINQVELRKFEHLKNEIIESEDNEEENEIKKQLISINNNKDFKYKLITIVLHESSRPRRAGRILLNKKNTTSLDIIINHINNFFKTDSIKKIYNINGVQILNPQDIFYNDKIFFAVSNERVHFKDFELDTEEIKLFYTNEFMSTYTNLNPSKIHERNLRKSAGYNRKKSKPNNSLIESSQNDLANMPEELLDNYEIGKVIGDGNYSIVRECKDISTGIMFALKIIDLRKCAGKEKMFENELNILRKVKHHNIVKLVEEYRTNDFVYLVFEYYKAGDLLEAVKNRKKFLEKDAAAMIYSLALALTYLHSLNIVHRDVKLDNILIQQYTDGSKSLKLGDFGLATIVNGPLKQKCGSPVYVAPEVLLGKEYTFEIDVWSLGIIAYILLCGYAPFQGENEEDTLELIKTGELRFIESDWENISPKAVNLIKKMLDRNQETRIKVSDILDDTWFIQEEKPSETTESNFDNTIISSNDKSFNRKKLDPNESLKSSENKYLKSQTKSAKNQKSTSIPITQKPNSKEVGKK